jgi:hypothetical protein
LASYIIFDLIAIKCIGGVDDMYQHPEWPGVTVSRGRSAYVLALVIT